MVRFLFILFTYFFCHLGHAQPIPIGVVLPLSGPGATMGKDIFNGLQLGLFQRSSLNLTLYPLDTQGNPPGTVAAVEMALEKHPPFIIGPLDAQETLACRDVMGGHNTFLLSFSNNETIISPQIYAMGCTVSLQIKKLMDFAHQQKCKTFVGIFTPTITGHMWGEAFKKYGTVIYYDPLKKSEGDMKKMMGQIHSINPEGIFIPEGGNNTLNLIAHLKYHDPFAKKRHFMGSMGWDHANMKKDQNLKGSWYITYPVAEWNAFSQAYHQAFGSYPGKMAFLAYKILERIESHLRGTYLWDQEMDLEVMEI